MFSVKEYPCQCHVCGRIWTDRTTFLSAPSIVGSDGIERVMQSCNADPTGPRHSGAEIRAAWEARCAS